MFDIAPSEFLLIAIVAIVVIGPKDMPLALRTAGRWIGKMRRMSNHVRSGFEAMIREAEMEELNRTWREQNEAIMRANPNPPEVTSEMLPQGMTQPPASETSASQAMIEGEPAPYTYPDPDAPHPSAGVEAVHERAPQPAPPVLP